jgi:quercetin dioxygenase-like cupin family protein
MRDNKLNLQALFDGITNYFSPRIIGEVNDVYIKLAKVKGQDVPWHTHDGEDELFYVISGRLTIELRSEKPLVLAAGEMFIVRQGIEHRVYSDDECRIMLIENKTTEHTGKTKSAITKSVDEQKY